MAANAWIESRKSRRVAPGDEKQHLAQVTQIAAEERSRLPVQKRDATRRVTRRVKDLQHAVPEVDPVAVPKRARPRRGCGRPRRPRSPDGGSFGADVVLDWRFPWPADTPRVRLRAVRPHIRKCSARADMVPVEMGLQHHRHRPHPPPHRGDRRLRGHPTRLDPPGHRLTVLLASFGVPIPPLMTPVREGDERRTPAMRSADEAGQRGRTGRGRSQPGTTVPSDAAISTKCK